jgi:type II secretory pathway component PulF
VLVVFPWWQKIELRTRQYLFDIKQQQAFLEDVASLIEDGVPLKSALETVVRINKGSEQILATTMLLQIAAGKSLAEGMRGWYPDAIIEVIRAGEEGGVLPKAMRAAAASLTKRETVFTSLFNSLVYPVVVLIAALGVAVFINHSILDSFRQLTPMSQWPSGAKTLVAFANFIEYWWWLIVIAMGVLIFLIVRFVRDYIGDARAWLDKLPLISLYRKLSSARLMETLGLLISNGLVLKRAIKVLQYRADPYLASHLLLMEHRLGAGRDNIADVLDTGLISDYDLSRLRLISQSKGFEHALVRQGQRASDEGMRAIQNTGRVSAGILMALVAMFAIFMIISVYSVGFSVVPSM